MRSYHLIAGLLFAANSMMKPTSGTQMLFNFTSPEINLANWSEISDTVRDVGMSKATLSLQKTQLFQRAIFFTLLNPQPNGAAFAGVRTPVHWDLRDYDELSIKCRGTGQNFHYKIVMRHRNQTSNDGIEYEQPFDAPGDFARVLLPLNGFKPYKWGREMEGAENLDLTDVTMFGVQMYGGVFSKFKQSGVSALEIETIEVGRADYF